MMAERGLRRRGAPAIRRDQGTWVRTGRRFMQSQKLNGVDVVGFAVSEPQSALPLQQEAGCRKAGWTGSLLEDRLLPGLELEAISGPPSSEGPGPGPG
uniref:Uncharacterized protein n=1 Tax=Rangifer tarandus platyrhynchus TaxID=3082113 RepID=A0ACB0EW37_RANTA|nr:unnamed protein product [Rangifer tarandus platyrhynchus]